MKEAVVSFGTLRNFLEELRAITNKTNFCTRPYSDSPSSDGISEGGGGWIQQGWYVKSKLQKADSLIVVQSIVVPLSSSSFISTSSFHLFLGLPLLLVPSSFSVKIFLGILSSSILASWPNQLIIWNLSILLYFVVPPEHTNLHPAHCFDIPERVAWITFSCLSLIKRCQNSKSGRYRLDSG